MRQHARSYTNSRILKGKIIVLRSAFDEILQNKYGYIEIKNLCLLTFVIFTNIIYIFILNKEQ